MTRPSSSFEMTRHFHEVMELPAPGELREPTVEERVLRAKLLMEETLETIEKGLGLQLAIDGLAFNSGFESWDIIHLGGNYDPIETLDGLADVKVIANGTAVQFGLPMQAADEAVFDSNMSKLDDDGRPINNECIGVWDEGTPEEKACMYTASGRLCTDPNHLRDPSQPVGKRLKGPNFCKPNIAGLLESVCPEHTASAHDPKVCGKCGTHIDELRP